MRKILTILCLFFAVAAFAQPPLIMPFPEQQFFTPTGTVCSGCFVYSYVSGSFTPLPTYTDATGLVANTNPVILNSAGYPQTSNGTQVGIWLTSGATYRIVLQNAAHIPIYQVDGVTGSGSEIFTSALDVAVAACNQMVIGVSPNTTSLCFPAPPASGIVLTFPSTASDTMVARSTTDTLYNKTLVSPSEQTPIVNDVQIAFSPGTYVAFPNASPTGTTQYSLTKLIGSPSAARIAATSDTTGILGVCTSSCGTSGNAVIQESGQTFCNFDSGGVVAGDLVQISTTVAGDCHDSGSPTFVLNQPIGIATVTNPGVAGTYALTLFAPTTARAFNNVGGTPTVACGSGAGTGGTKTCTIVGGSSDLQGWVIVSTGTAPSNSNAPVFILTFSTPFSTFVTCLVNNVPNTTGFAPTQSLYVGSAGVVNNFTLFDNGTALTGSGVYEWAYLCTGY